MLTRNEIEKDEDIIDLLEIPEVIVRLRRDGIVHVTFRKDTVFDIVIQMNLLKLNNQITTGKKSYFIFVAEENVSITREARDNATKIEDLSPTVGSVVVANNLAYRMIANFYVKFNRPKHPFKVVGTFDEAVRWLKTLAPL
jgi:hypothetical protein